MTRQLHLSVSYDGAATWPAVRSLVDPLLSLCRIQTQSEGVYVYVLNPREQRLQLTAWNGISPSAVERFEAELNAEAAAWQDSRFRNFSEFVQHRFESALAVPLRASASVAGAVNFCRRDALRYEPADAILAASIGRSLGQLVARSSVCPSAVARFPIENEVLSDSEANHVR